MSKAAKWCEGLCPNMGNIAIFHLGQVNLQYLRAIFLPTCSKHCVSPLHIMVLIINSTEQLIEDGFSQPTTVSLLNV